ncbi:MAG TPA: M20/M25/M40 family metallo-hydrolase [Candidatus Saccharimonadales bacterium]|nr:M20/M25/M40 family metallo-hydrolase [Candidatus Saccharimonadales bacterium]
MTEKQLIEATKRLIAIPSTGDNYEALKQALDFIAAMIWAQCPDVTIERFESNSRPSLLAYRGEQRPDRFRILFNGHLDVVPGKPEQYKAVVKDGKLFGRGVYDMKAACVALTDVFCQFVNEVPYSLGLQIVTDEESAGSDGTQHQIKQGVRADFVVCGECGRHPNVYEIANEAKGIAAIDVAFPGVAAHSAYPWKGENAALRASNFIQALHKHYPAPEEETHETTVSVTALAASSGAHSKLPDRATMMIVARYTAADPNFRSLEQVLTFLQRLDPDIEIVNVLDFSSPLYTNPSNSLLLRLKATAEKVEAAEFSFVRRHGTGDGRFYGDVGGEACEFGVAGDHAHADGEYITLEAFHNYIVTMRQFMEQTITSEPKPTHIKAHVA